MSEMKRYRVTAIRGSIVKKAEITFMAFDANDAEKIADEMVSAIDVTAYIDSIDEMA